MEQRLTTSPNRVRLPLLIGGLALLTVVLVVSLLTRPGAFLESYLVGLLYWLGPSLGSLAVLMVHRLTGGAWGVAIARPAHAAVRTLPLVLLLLVPFLLLAPLTSLYPWMHVNVTDPGAQGYDLIVARKALYLNLPFFFARAALYLVIWLGLAWGISRAGIAHRTRQRISGLGLVLYMLTMSFAAFDWGMSLDPHWFSTIYGAMVIVGQIFVTFALVTLITVNAHRHEQPGSRFLPPQQLEPDDGRPLLPISVLHDLGNFLLMSVTLWAYMNFCQYLIIWYGNLPEETPWYQPRTLDGPWAWVGVALIVLHFVVPFAILLLRRAKRRAGAVRRIAVYLLVMHLVDLLYLLVPSFPRGEGEGWRMALDVLAVLGVGGVWLAAFAWQYARLEGQLPAVAQLYPPHHHHPELEAIHGTLGGGQP